MVRQIALVEKALGFTGGRELLRGHGALGGPHLRPGRGEDVGRPRDELLTPAGSCGMWGWEPFNPQSSKFRRFLLLGPSLCLRDFKPAIKC